MAQNMSRSRGWCFTINNPTEQDKDNVTGIINNECDIGIAEMEHVNQGTAHIQGYLHFELQKTFNSVLRLFISHPHLEKANGTWADNFVYCSKENQVFIIKGRTLEQASNNKGKNNFRIMYDFMKTATPEQFEEMYPKEWYLRRQLVERVMIDSRIRNEIADWNGDLQEKNIWIWGDAGVGKSRWAMSQGTAMEVFKKGFNKWWDGYRLMRTKCVIIDDWPCMPAGNSLSWHIKIWGDRYAFTGECKGSHTWVSPGKFFIIITSNYPIDQCFEKQEDIEAIHRRFKEVHCTNGDLYSQCMVNLDKTILHE